MDIRDTYFKIYWDPSKRSPYAVMWGKQSDTGRGMEVILIANGKAIAPIEGEILRISWQALGGDPGYVNAVLDSGHYYFDDLSGLFAVAGDIPAQLELQKGDKFLQSDTFTIPVLEPVAEGALLSSDNLTALQAALAQVSSLEERFDAAIAALTVDGEVITARAGHPSLNARLDANDTAVAGKAPQSDTYTKTEVDNKVAAKVDKVTGKGLSTEDYTTAEKTKVANVPADTTTELAAVNSSLAAKANQSKMDKIDTEIYAWSPYGAAYTWNSHWNLVGNDFFTSASTGYMVVDVSEFRDHLKIKSAWANQSAPAVAYFSGDPSAATYLGCDGKGASAAVENLTDITCTIPDGCTKVILQGFYTETYTLMEFESAIVKNSLPIVYSVTGGVLEVKTVYPIASTYAKGTKLSVKFGKRGVNQLPDFNEIVAGTDILNAGSTDWHAPFMVAAKNNIDGDNVSPQTFTGGNHNYNNTGTLDASATARNVSLKFVADGKVITDGAIGNAKTIEIHWVNRVQAYNTRKVDGTGREVLEERHKIVFDGVKWESTVEIVPLEDISLYTWYGFQASMPVTHHTNYKFIGGVNRTAYARLTNASAGSKTANGIISYGQFHKCTMEIDRKYDIGDTSLYTSAETNGVFTSGGKAYSLLVYYKPLTANNIYHARAFYKFEANF